MTNATSVALRAYWQSTTFGQLTLLALVCIGVLAVAVVEQEVLRAVNPTLRRRNGRVLAIAIYPLAIFAVALVIARFVRLA